MFNNIVFDFDGVIIDSHELQVKALKKSFNEIYNSGIPPYDDFFKLSGNSLKNVFTQLGLSLNMIPIYQKVSRENINLIKVHEGIMELLESLKEKKRNCFICTGKDRERTIDILKYFKIEHYFRMVVCSDDVINPKPHGESLYLIMNKLGVCSNDIVMIGDGINDIMAAKNAGIKSIAVSWGDVSKDELQKYKADYLVDTVKDLAKILE